MGRSRAIAGWSQLLGLFPGICGDYLRHAFYKFALAEVKPDSVISFGVLFSDCANHRREICIHWPLLRDR